ncbi:MAG: aldo/keto reductase [bacterium]
MSRTSPPGLLSEARAYLDEPIYANQVEMHPLLQQDHLREDAVENDTVFVAYSPFRHGTIFDLEEINSIADKHGVTPAQVVLAWVTSYKNVVTIPKATGEEHLRENFEALTLELDAEDIETIESIEREDRYIDPPFAPDWED